ncbi:hypothetical protein [Leisingera aquaemixtae]|uniref:hypothetical protein n=1 Tax=Leisingera aquaemixtae TaxID=1396826 RepID=UPI0021A57EBD|nr:hypothetical protein [Leisingera aquaemixtae]UWQ48143.1 hypothetical protein K3719_21120 [Leisingera aquaemixtae]
MELCVRQGAVTVSLRQVMPDGSLPEYCRLDCPAPGSAFSPPVFTAQTQGVLLPVVEAASPDAVYDLYFGTNEAPLLPAARTAFILEGSGPDLDAAAAAFGRFLEEHARHGAAEAAHLVLVDNEDAAPALAGSRPGAGVSRIANGATGVPGTGRGLYEACYGSLAAEGFTHLCLLRAGRRPQAGMFAHAAAFMRFLRPEAFLCAPPADGSADGADPAALMRRAQTAATAPWDWCCLDARSIHRHGLPCPFPVPAAEREYSARLQRAGLQLAAPLSFQPAADQAPPGYGAQLTLRALQGELADPDALRAEFSAAVRSRAAAGGAGGAWALMNEMDAFLAGPEAMVLPAARPPRPPLRPPFRSWRLQRRLRRQLRALSRLPQLVQRCSAARARLATIACWAQMAGNQPAADPALVRPGRAETALQRQRELAALHLKADTFHRAEQNARSRQLRQLEDRLAHNRLLDTARAHADQDRASQILLSVLRNRHKGARAVIVGNGPSLRVSDLDRLHNSVTFASNKIYLAYEDTCWRPDYYSVEDHLVIQNNWERIAGLEGSLKIFPANVRDFGYHAADTVFVPFRPPRSFEDPLSDPDFPAFSEDLSHGICWGSTIVYSQIQMALFMGCAEIVLIGLDHSYVLPKVKQGNTYLHAGEQNHFHPGYRETGERWHQPNLEVLEVSYARARARCEARGVRVLNASRQTRLEVFERAAFDTLFPPGTPAKETA